ncbi:MAG: preprotein translocase subunit SecE [Sphingomonadaceae bacterium]
MAKINPGKFIREVRAETARVVWPTSRETVTTTIMVIIMASVLGLFFFSLDSLFSWIVRMLLSFVG